MDSSAASLIDLKEGELPEWAPKDLSGKHLVMCEYYLAGFGYREIGAVLGYHEGYVGQILRSPVAKSYIAQRIEDLNTELHGQFRQVVKNMTEALAAESPDIRLKATEMWFKAHGRFAPKKAGTDGPVSAEEVVQRLLEHAKTVNINIDNRRVDKPPPTVDNFDFLEK